MQKASILRLEVATFEVLVIRVRVSDSWTDVVCEALQGRRCFEEAVIRWV